jgi:hypothetical protein
MLHGTRYWDGAATAGGEAPAPSSAESASLSGSSAEVATSATPFAQATPPTPPDDWINGPGGTARRYQRRTR